MTRFEKYQALGNDFILLNSPPDAFLHTQTVLALCNRNLGIGADGVIQILPPSTKSEIAFMRIYNSDGSLASLCMNGFRCVAFWLLHQKYIQPKENYQLGTDSGPRMFRIEDDICSVQLKGPRWEIEETLADGTKLLGLYLGNYHLVAYHPFMDLTKQATSLAPQLALHPWAHLKANIELVKVLDNSNVEMVVYELGAGFTLACGSGALACVAALTKLGKLEHNVDVKVWMPGGFLWVTLDTHQLTLKGQASKVFEGTIDIGDQHAHF